MREIRLMCGVDTTSFAAGTQFGYRPFGADALIGSDVKVGRKKRVGFADLQATHAELARGEVKCPECNRVVSEADGLKYVPALGQRESSLATLNCPRCRTMLSVRFLAANEAPVASDLQSGRKA